MWASQWSQVGMAEKNYYNQTKWISVIFWSIFCKAKMGFQLAGYVTSNDNKVYKFLSRGRLSTMKEGLSDFSPSLDILISKKQQSWGWFIFLPGTCRKRPGTDGRLVGTGNIRLPTDLGESVRISSGLHLTGGERRWNQTHSTVMPAIWLTLTATSHHAYIKYIEKNKYYTAKRWCM